MPILILPPDPGWPAAFLALAARLAPALPPGALIHHIGSTAVPGLPAKPVIDVQVTVPDLAAFDPKPLTRAGLEARGPALDHEPPGLTLPAAELQKHFFRAETPIRAHIHIRETGRFNTRYALLCRDYLRSHPAAAAAYAEIKQNLARLRPDDADAYYAVKDPVFDLLMAGAEDWAAATHWTLPPADFP